MGVRLVIKGADFSTNAVSKSQNYEKVKVGTNPALWDLANVDAGKSTTGEWTNLGFGFKCDYDGYITGIETMPILAKGVIRVVTYNSGNNGVVATSNDIEVEQGQTSFVCSPVRITSGQIVTILVKRLAKGTVVKYGHTGGDVKTYTGGNTDYHGSEFRVYPWNFIVSVPEK